MRNTLRTPIKKNNVHISTTPIYGLLFEKLESDKDSYVLAFGDISKVHQYKKEYHLKGDIKTYKCRGWLVKRIENLKYKYRDDVTILYLE